MISPPLVNFSFSVPFDPQLSKENKHNLFWGSLNAFFTFFTTNTLLERCPQFLINGTKKFPVVSSRSRGQFLTYKVIMKILQPHTPLILAVWACNSQTGSPTPFFHISLGLEEVWKRLQVQSYPNSPRNYCNVKQSKKSRYNRNNTSSINH